MLMATHLPVRPAQSCVQYSPRGAAKMPNLRLSLAGLHGSKTGSSRSPAKQGVHRRLQLQSPTKMVFGPFLWGFGALSGETELENVAPSGSASPFANNAPGVCGTAARGGRLPGRGAGSWWRGPEHAAGAGRRQLAARAGARGRGGVEAASGVGRSGGGAGRACLAGMGQRQRCITENKGLYQIQEQRLPE